MVLAHDITKGNRTRDVKTAQDITFETMLLSPNTMQGLKDSGFYKPSPIQLCGIPIGKCGFDLLLEAKSGTGKTAVYSIIALEKLDFTKGLQVVILTPTREIAAQTCDVLKQIGARYKDLQIEVVMGGLPFKEDVQKFQKTVHIVVGSPGRLKHLMQKNHIDSSAVRLLVLDEADKLMEKAFQPDIRYIHTALPNQKQVIMSSATFSESAKAFINNYVQNANHLCPDSDSILLGVTQKVTFVKYNSNIVRQTQDRFKELLHILVKIQFKQCLVFCNYQARVSEIHKLLKKEKWPSEQLYGQQEQVDRLDALKTLQQYKCRILVSTDLASRGIDASNIDLVVNFEPPNEWQTYLHRIGRAGRFGSYGLAVTILSEGKELQRFKDMLKSMELPINMYNLWTDKRFNVDDNVIIHSEVPRPPYKESTPTIDLLEEVNHVAVWDMISCESNERNALESFESLCKSQEKSHVKEIDTFSDLMLSLKNLDCQENEENLFKHIEMRKSSATISTCQEKDMAFSNPAAVKNENIFITELRNININNGHSEEYTAEIYDNEDNNNYVEETSKHLNGVNSDAVTNNNANINTMIENKADVKCSENELPIKLSINNNTYIDSDSERSKIYNKYYDRPEHSGEKVNNNSFNSMEHTCDGAEVHDDDHVHKYASYQSRKYRMGNHNKQKARVKAYYDWYNQLKINKQRIEQAIYIDEMSRM